MFSDQSSWIHLRTNVTPDLHITYSNIGEIWGWNKMIKFDIFLYFSIKSYVLDVYKNRLDSNSHPQHMILLRTESNYGKITTMILSFVKTL